MPVASTERQELEPMPFLRACSVFREQHRIRSCPRSGISHLILALIRRDDSWHGLS